MDTTPYPGLRAYDATESEYFFGRDEQLKELLARLRQRRFVAVVGMSGSGKSSLVRAGLIPALQHGYLAGAGSSWRVALLRPGGDPIGELARATGSALGVPEGETRAELSRDSLGLAHLAQRRLGPGENLLIVVDQFEELFRYHRQSDDRAAREACAAFTKLLLTAAGRPEVPLPELDHLPIFVVITMRSDYFGTSSQFRGLPEALNDSQYLVPRLTRDQLREAIEGPAGMAGTRITPRLVQRLLNDVGDDPNQLPVIQHVLLRLWEVSSTAREQGLPLDAPHYDDESVGGMSRALNLDADRALAAVGDDTRKQDIARRIFQRLVEPMIEAEARRPTRLSELAAVCESPVSDVLTVIAPFARRGFLVLSDDADPIVDISHESLIRMWSTLKHWVQEESDSARLYLRLADWVKDDFAPYSGIALQQALTWRKTQRPNAAWASRYRSDPAIFDRSLQFLESAHRAERRHAATRTALRWGSVVMTAVLLIAASVYAWRRNRVLQSENTQLFASADSLAGEAANSRAEAAALLARQNNLTALGSDPPLPLPSSGTPAGPTQGSGPTIKHLIVLMMDNRSFDHMLGTLKQEDPRIDGLTGRESNPDSAGQLVLTTPRAQFQGQFTTEPPTDFRSVDQQIFNGGTGSARVPSMLGFVNAYFGVRRDVNVSHRIMYSFAAQKLPVLTTLAREFAVCDRWFSSIPGPGIPNRAFVHYGTSFGRTDQSLFAGGQTRTAIVTRLLAARRTAKIYHFDEASATLGTLPLLLKDRSIFSTFKQFLLDAGAGTLPDYSFVEPNHADHLTEAGTPIIASDQSPDHHVGEGERFIATVYNTIRSNEALWRESLLVITYSSHGGFYDHVPPPSAVNPDGVNDSSTGFDFQRLGVRVPAVIISPYVLKGTVVHDTIFDHTSIPATAAKLFLGDRSGGTRREQSAATVDSVLTLKAPRTDAPSFQLQ